MADEPERKNHWPEVFAHNAVRNKRGNWPQCKDCRFWQSAADEWTIRHYGPYAIYVVDNVQKNSQVGRCRRRSAQNAGNNIHVGMMGGWPETSADDWCAEGKRCRLS